MNLENKQRVIGIVVLVVFILLLIPFLFTSGVKKRHELAKESNPENVINELMDGSTKDFIPDVDEKAASSKNSVEDVTSKALSGKSQEDKLADEAGPIVLPSDVQYMSHPVVEESVEEDVSVSAPVPSSHQKSLPAIVDEQDTMIIKQESGPVMIDQFKKPKPKPKKPVRKSGVYWTVQVGSFLDGSKAEKLAEEIQHKGFDVYSQSITTTRGLMIRVLVGREDNRSAAKMLAAKLKTKLNLDGFVVSKK